jgi:NAD(P)H-flavin reductase
MIADARRLPTDPMLPTPCTLLRSRRETADTVTLELAPPDGQQLAFEPGQFNMLYLFGLGESAISISGNPDRTDRVVHTVRAVGTVTRPLLKLARGASIGVRGPYGRPWPLTRAHGRDVVLIAGGIGLAPLRPVIYRILADRSAFGRVTLLFGARSPADLLYRTELERWRGRLDSDVRVTVDHAGEDWTGDVGVVTALLSRAAFDPARTTAMLCGPEIMMRSGVRELLARGVPAGDVFVSMERNMKCAVGFCGHCQLGPSFVCRDGPVFDYATLAPWFEGREL